jgi:hypothetical protein
LPLAVSPFEKGSMGMTANEVLMIKGLIHPLMYLDFVDLQKLSAILSTLRRLLRFVDLNFETIVQNQAFCMNLALYPKRSFSALVFQLLRRFTNLTMVT